MIVLRNFIICFENMICSFENMTLPKKGNCFIRKYDLLIQGCAKATRKLDELNFAECFRGRGALTVRFWRGEGAWGGAVFVLPLSPLQLVRLCGPQLFEYYYKTKHKSTTCFNVYFLEICVFVKWKVSRYAFMF